MLIDEFNCTDPETAFKKTGNDAYTKKHRFITKKERRPTALRRGERKRASETEARLREREQEMRRKQTGRKQGRREERTHRKKGQGGKRNLPGQGSSEQD